MVAAWKQYFTDVPGVEIHLNSAFAVPTECVVSPANSFLFQDGGFDAAITSNLGTQVQVNAQKIVREQFNGELLVGQAFYFETNNPVIPYCIAASTMRVPMYLGPKSVNAYLAARAIFLLLKNNPPFKTVTIPGLGTGVGAVPYDICAKQMYKAYEDYYLNDTSKFPNSWHEAQMNHQLLFKPDTSQVKDIQYKDNN